MTLAQQVWLHRPGTPQRELLCEGRVRVGWVDAASMKPARIPADILEKLHS